MRFPKYRVSLVREASGIRTRKPIEGQSDCERLLRPYFRDLDREHFVILLLDSRHRPSGMNVVSVGTLDMSVVHPRETFKVAILASAAAIILAHNHPTGETSPSREDLELTRRLIDAGRMLGIPVLDHLIFGEKVLSMRAAGFIEGDNIREVSNNVQTQAV